MARVASCPQCNHELLVPSEAESESWAKCPECRAFFQVKQATSREVRPALLVDASEQHTIDLESQDVAPPTLTAQDDLETAVAEHLSPDYEVAATLNDDLEPGTLIDEPKREDTLDETAVAPEEAETAVAPQETVDHGITATHDDDLGSDNLIEEPKNSDDLAATAQRIDEWFRSAKTVPDAAPIGEDDETPSVEENTNDLATSGPSRTKATLDMDESDADDLAEMADFDLDEPDEQSAMKTIADTPAWDDTAQMDDLLGDGDAPPADDFVAEFADADDADGVETGFTQEEPSAVASPTSGDEGPAINLFADSDSLKVELSKRRARRRERSFARSLVMILVAGIFGLAGGYYALLWLRGPSIDFLNVAQYLPPAMLPASFDESKQIVRNTPPANTIDTPADVAPTTTDESTEPQELPPATDDAAEPMPDASAATDAAPAGAADQSTEVPASYSEEQSANASDIESSAANASTATDVTSEKPATTDLSLDDLAPADAPATDATVDPSATTEPSLPASTAPADTGLATTETPASEPATLDVTSADPLSDISNASGAIESVEIKIANAPSSTADDLQTSMDAATNAQPQLVAGNFADSKAVAQAKGRSYAMLADLAQKALFADTSQQAAKLMVEQAEELFRTTLADAHARGEVAQILPRWVQSPNRKHGGVFFAGTVVSHVPAGSVIECNVRLDGGQTLTVLAPANAADQLDTAKPIAIVGWIVDAPKTQVSGYTGTAKASAIWTKKLTPIE